MKKLFIVLAALASLVSCRNTANEFYSSWETDDGAPKGNLTVNIKGLVNEPSKYESEPFSDVLDVEGKFSSIQIVVFDSVTGNFVTSENYNKKQTSFRFTLPVGTYDIYAFVNAPRDMETWTLDEYDKYYNFCYTLEDYTNVSRGFPMNGMEQVEVIDGNVNVDLKVKRLVARVALDAFRFHLPEVYRLKQINCIYLANVRGECERLGDKIEFYPGNKSKPRWYNMQGRSFDFNNYTYDNGMILFGAGLGPVISRENPSVLPSLLYYQPEGTGLDAEVPSESGGALYVLRKDGHPLCFYGFENVDAETPCVSENFIEMQTMLVISCKIQTPDDEVDDYYYSVPLDNFERNTSTTLYVEVVSIGSKNPAEPVVKGTIKSTVVVEEWGDNGVLEEVI